MATDVAGEDFVTIVPVGEGLPATCDPSFVTVLTVGAITGAAEVIIRRPRGARLGLGLKFEGGSAAAEKVKRLLVQSCAVDSPAANARTPWGKLIPGDEILAIDSIPVSELTRIDCVRRLKDSDETLVLLLRHFETNTDVECTKNINTTDSPLLKNLVSDITRPILPPPVPPRKLGKKHSFKEKSVLQTVGEQNGINNNLPYNQELNSKDCLINGLNAGITKLSRKSSFDSHILRQNKDALSFLKKGSPEEVRRLVRRMSDGKTMPPEAEVYIDLLSTEWERCLAMADAESDDTGSSISTVVDRLGSMASSVENSIPSTPIMQHKTIDIQKVLNCIENIDSNILNDITSSNLIEKLEVKSETRPEKSQQPNSLNRSESDKIQKLEQSKVIPKLMQLSDKNNNNTVTQNVKNSNTNSDISQTEKFHPKLKCDVPKPMPRNTKVERSLSEKKPKTIKENGSLVSTQPATDMLLTPTKKNCIETWLQHSEAEMNGKVEEKLDDINMPEALPRLIDFVPKPAYMECSPDTPPPLPLTRPTTAPPPPPPAESREDGSGASLDTIGELDENTETANEKLISTTENKTSERKPTFERHFWDDRISKSDAEDKSLSNDETPLPTCPRQPPDGVETPSETIEKVPEPPSRPPPRINPGWSLGTPRPRYSYSSRTQDPRSEASVKDKIAMFSNDNSTSSDILDKCGTLPSRTPSTARKNNGYSNGYSDVSSLDRRLTKSQENLDDLPRSYLRIDRPEVVGAFENSTHTKNNFTISQSIPPKETSRKSMFYGSTNTLPMIIDAPTESIYHSRSASDDTSAKKVHKSNLEYLIEQRKKSMSKLRGLVIPEAQAPIIDLPEIKVKDSLAKVFIEKPRVINLGNNKPSKLNTVKPTRISEDVWNTNLLPNNIPKYSPAFKRKSLQVYTPSGLSKESTPERKFLDKVDALSKMTYQIPYKTPNMSSLSNKNGTAKVITSDLSSQFLLKNMKVPNNILNEIRDFKNVEVKICTATDVVDSDNDSAMSSTQSSFRSSASSPLHQLDSIESDGSRLSPRTSHYTSYNLIRTEIPSKSSITEKSCGEYIKRIVCRSVSSDTNVSLSSSAGSAATSGSQASCSSLESSAGDSDKTKVTKSFNVDTINRRNILASAKCRSGRDAKLKSPVLEAKFSHEIQNKSPVLVPPKSSERLSSLTSSVSALTNKGETRRRNKIVAETDSESDCEVNVRQRKTDFKNTRLKRNSSSNNKTKVNENNFDVITTEIPLKNVTEKFITEIKKTEIEVSQANSVTDVSDNKVESKNNNSTPNIKKEEFNEREVKIIQSEDKDVANELNLNYNNRHTKTLNGNSADGSHIAERLSANANLSKTIKLRRGAGTGVGLILAGGIDCEAKDVTVHRVLGDSVAAKAGLKRGAKIRSINGCSMFGLTHAQSVAILKEQRSEIAIEIEVENEVKRDEQQYGSEKAELKTQNTLGEKKLPVADENSNAVVTVSLEKAGGGAGLGFGLDGGRDSPHGDKPLTIKKLFAGGAAAQSGRIIVGAELVSAGGQSMEGFTRTQAWAALKALPAGTVTLVLKNPK